LLNSEPDSAASYHFQLHGPSVCAIGLRVDDAQRALSRAKALRCSLWQEPIGAGERVIPAVRAPDGMLINLIEPDRSGRTIYEDDFQVIAEPGSEAELVAIDHIAQALPVGRMEAAALFWRAVFGFVPQPLWEIPDPYGLVRSRAMVSREGSIRLPLNISEGRETATGRFVSASAGAGVHHLAFASQDIVRTLAAMPGRDYWILPIPPNYYDDLGARYGLADEELVALRELNLLYERDDDGSFRDAYTDSFEDRFFFEIVERRGYRGFGALNAAVRMAAQAQRRGGGDLVARMRVALL
jgi:4-hydroxyphenylpyruvate dioxygenase